MSYKSKKNFSLNKILTLVLICLVSLIFLATIVIAFLTRFPNLNSISMSSYYNYESEDTVLVVDGTVATPENAPVSKNNVTYIPIDFVKLYIDPYIFWDETYNQVIVTTSDEVIRMPTEDLTYTINNEPFTLNFPIYNIEGTAYLPTNLLEELYNVEFVYNENKSILTMNFTDKDKQYTTVSKKNVKLRSEPTNQSEYITILPKNSIVYVYEESDEFTKVRTTDGEIGYIKTKDLNEVQIEEAVINEKPPTSNTPPIEGNIVMLWDQVFTVDANSADFRQEPVNGVNVISPTWFAFDLESQNGDIINIADKAYVDWAHSQGYQVWPTINDFPEGTDVNVAHDILSDSKKRENAIVQIMSFISIYDLDGINIDFEYVNEEDAIYFLQFLRELYPLMQEQGKILSVDVYVPKPWTEHYNRSEIAKTADYLIIMAYDEHYSGSSTSGPVASIGFVEDGIKNTLLEVPADQIILGIPFYERVWREEQLPNGEIDLSKTDMGMQKAYDLFISNGASFSWIEEQGVYYSEYYTVENGNKVTYKLWLEDERSIQLKIDLAKQYDLAGIAFWKRGLEKDSIWDEIIVPYSLE